MSKQMLISGLLIIVAFAAAFACLAITPDKPPLTISAYELQNQVVIEQLAEMKLI